jgi:hypothetical protein
MPFHHREARAVALRVAETARVGLFVAMVDAPCVQPEAGLAVGLNRPKAVPAVGMAGTVTTIFQNKNVEFRRLSSCSSLL